MVPDPLVDTVVALGTNEGLVATAVAGCNLLCTMWLANS